MRWKLFIISWTLPSRLLSVLVKAQNAGNSNLNLESESNVNNFLQLFKHNPQYFIKKKYTFSTKMENIETWNAILNHAKLSSRNKIRRNDENKDAHEAQVHSIYDTVNVPLVLQRYESEILDISRRQPRRRYYKSKFTPGKFR